MDRAALQHLRGEQRKLDSVARPLPAAAPGRERRMPRTLGACEYGDQFSTGLCARNRARTSSTAAWLKWWNW